MDSNSIDIKQNLLTSYSKVRSFSEEITKHFETEDFVVQSMPDASPIRWHLAHTSWFFETFILREYIDNYKPISEIYNYLFNSYYVQAGKRYFRPHRGLITRPTVKEVMEYRNYVDNNIFKLIDKLDFDKTEQLKVLMNIGLNHEQQHQELIITDIKHAFSFNPLYPSVFPYQENGIKNIDEIKFKEYEEGIYEFGYNGNSFYFDNEKPFHKRYIQPFKVADRLVTNKEFIEFIEDNGYKRDELWLSDGISTVREFGWEAPLYWFFEEGKWFTYTLAGRKEVNFNEPVSHISYYEADAFARWKNARLLTEFEWELVARNLEVKGNFADSKRFHPAETRKNNETIQQMYGDLWEWTQSDYAPYPGYKTPKGAIGEYNGKFMSGQYILRGGSCATFSNHIRSTYRNFFYPHSRWQFSGIRLAKDIC